MLVHRFGEEGREWALVTVCGCLSCHWLRMKAGSTGGATEPGQGHFGSTGEEGDGTELLRPGG